MPTWDLFLRMLSTPAADLHKIRKAIESRHTFHDHGALENCLDEWRKEHPGKWMTDQSIDEIIKEEDI